jgi:hypothetical protein
MYGFEIGQMKNHESALILIRSTLLIAAYLGDCAACAGPPQAVQLVGGAS